MNAKQLLESMAEIESRIAVIYERFVVRFHDVPDVTTLWESMSREELHHAELLSLAAGAATGAPVDAAAVRHVETLQTFVTQQEAAQPGVAHLQDALRVTADLEEAEAEHLHATLEHLGGAASGLLTNPAMAHRSRDTVEHVIRVFGGPALQERLAWRRFYR
ncbi:MAG TPA: hypothetical protein VMW17_16845 [Candidatus Binatia bacterium]|nr:hypothetical protein [Candidatus Binatia bacterium]